MREQYGKTGSVLTAEEVKSRKARSMSEDFCYVSLVPLTDDTRFTVLGPNEQYNVHKKYGEEILEAFVK
jgi:hypothetical protein